jgi:hypothetical protein
LKIALGSIFSSSASAGHLDYYIPQVVALRDALEPRGDSLVCLWVEGDSRDNTFNELQRRAESARLDYRLRQVNHGGTVYGSVDHPNRYPQLAMVGNAVLEMLHEEANVSVLIQTESDLQWKSSDMLQLLGRLDEGYKVVSPLILFYNGNLYDTWAFRSAPGNTPWQARPPFVAGFKRGMMPMTSTGSCVVATVEAAKSAWFSQSDCIRGWTREMGEKYGLWCDTSVAVVHPKRPGD